MDTRSLRCFIYDWSEGLSKIKENLAGKIFVYLVFEFNQTLGYSFQKIHSLIRRSIFFFVSRVIMIRNLSRILSIAVGEAEAC